MAAKKTQHPDEWERVLVRHVLESRRDDVARIDSLIQPPFHSTSRSSISGGTRATIMAVPRGRWMIAAEFTGQQWAALFCNCAAGEELVAANASNRRLEVAHIGYSSERGGWFARILKGGKKTPVAEFQQEDQDNDDFEAFQEFCNQFGLVARQYDIRAEGEEFQVLGLQGKPVKTALVGYIHYSGYALESGENPASDKLGKAVEMLNARRIRKAVEEGASLENLPDRSSDPLTSVLLKCGRPGWENAAETLLELGCSVDGVPGDDPPVISATMHFVPEETSLGILEFLVNHGVNLEATDSSGNTALYQAVARRRQRTIKFLLAHGADPRAQTSAGVTILEWLQSRVEDELARGYSRYAEILELLTDTQIRQPALDELTDELQQENERFQECVQVRDLLQLISTTVRLERIPVDPVREFDEYRARTRELSDLGFKKLGSYLLAAGGLHVYQTLFNHEGLAFDAGFTIGGPALDRLRLEVCAYHTDGTLTAVANVRNADLMEYKSQLADYEIVEGATAGELVERLQETLKADPRNRLPAAPEEFEQRFSEFNQRQLSEIRDYLQSVLETPKVFVDGRPARYELARCFLDIVSQEDPSWSTARITSGELEEIQRARAAEADAWRLGSGVRAAGNLLAMKNLEYAGAPDNWDFLADGSEIAVRFFEAESRRSKPFDDDWCVDELLFGWMCAMLADRWDDVARIGEALTPRFATSDARDSDDQPRELAWLLLSVASSFRKRAIRGVSRMEEQIAGCRHQQVTLLLDLWNALRAVDQQAFEESLVNSLAYRAEKHPVTYHLYDLRRSLGWPESLLMQLAAREGLTLPELPEPLDSRVLRIRGKG